MSRIVKPHEDAMANARLFLADCYAESANSLLRSHDEIRRAWSGSAWPELPKADLTSEIVLYFEGAMYEVRSNETVRRVPFLPSKARVREIEAAIDAVSHLSDRRAMPFWIDDGSGVSTNLPPEELVPMANGLLHVPTRELHSPTPFFFCPYALPYEYDASAKPPERFLRFLDELWPDDRQSRDLLQEFIGYLLVPDTSQQKILLLVGPPRSGKGTISRMIRDLVGHHNVAGPTLAGLATNFGLQPMIGKPVAIISDARLSSSKDNAIVVERLLSISGEDPLTFDRKYKSAWTSPLPTRLVILTNELPGLSDASGALANRFLILQMTRSFLGQEDHTLSVKIADELPGILLWALDGLDHLRERGHFLQPDRSSQVIQDLLELSSPMQAFINERCLVEPSRTVAIDDVYQEWVDWCDENGSHPGSKQTFAKDLHAALSTLETTQPRIDGARQRHYKGIGLARGGTRS